MEEKQCFLNYRKSLNKNKKISQKEAEFIRNTQNPDGTWNITWNWGMYPEEWHISKNRWKSDVIIKNVRFVSEMEK